MNDMRPLHIFSSITIVFGIALIGILIGLAIMTPDMTWSQFFARTWGMMSTAFVYVLVLPYINARGNRFIYGPYLKAEHVKKFLDNYLEEYEFSPITEMMVSTKNTITMPYIKKMNGLFCAYEIEGIGRVRRFSKAAKRIDNKRLRITYGL